MSAANEIRQACIDRLPTYYPADIWQEDSSPFTRDNPIVLTRQDGSPSDDVIRRHNVTVSLFTVPNASGTDRKKMLDDADMLLRYFLTNYTTDSIIDIEPITDVSSAGITSQNRYICQFTVATKSNFMRVS